MTVLTAPNAGTVKVAFSRLRVGRARRAHRQPDDVPGIALIR